MNRINTEFSKAVDKFLEVAEKRILEIGTTYHLPLSFKLMKRYVKIISGDKSVYAFIDFDGHIYMPATWDRPAKHVRGYIYSKGHGLEAIGLQYGSIRYLK